MSYHKKQEDLLSLCPYYVDGEIKFNIKPLRNIVFLWQRPPEDKIGSIYIPQSAQDKTKYGIGVVLACGPGGLDEKGVPYTTELISGDVVLFDDSVPWKYNHRQEDGTEYEVVIMGEKDAKCIVEGDDYKPLSDFVMVELIEEERTHSGLYMPTAIVKYAKVVDLGKDVKNVKVGDKVIVELRYAVAIVPGLVKKKYTIREMWINAIVED
jgi:co-chaperonin GroES (HSP10)